MWKPSPNFFCHLPIRNPIRTDLWSKPGLWGNRVNAPRSHQFLGRPQIVIMVNVSCELILQSSCHQHTQFYPDSWVLFVRDEGSVSRYLDLEQPAPPVTENINSWLWSRYDLRGNRGAGGTPNVENTKPFVDSFRLDSFLLAEGSFLNQCYEISE